MSGIDLSGKIALVTGASRGIGAVVAARLAEAGARVGVNYHASSEAATIVVDSINKAGGEAFLVGGDVSQEEKAEAVIKNLVEHFGGIDILINNAGINKDQLLIRMKPEDFDSVINVNLRGAFLCTRFAMTHLIRQRSGRVINMSSVVGLSGNPGQANYAAAKAGIHGFTKSLAMEVAKRGVTVNTVSPGYLETKMVLAVPKEILESKVISQIPVGRLGKPDELAALVAFICSEQAGFMTGSNVAMNGGQHMF